METGSTQENDDNISNESENDEELIDILVELGWEAKLETLSSVEKDEKKMPSLTRKKN